MNWPGIYVYIGLFMLKMFSCFIELTIFKLCINLEKSLNNILTKLLFFSLLTLRIRGCEIAKLHNE